MGADGTPTSEVTSISDLIGSWGPLQKKLFICSGIVYFIAPFSYSGLYFYGLNDDLWCKSANGTQTIIESNKCLMAELDSCDSWGFTSDRITVSKEWKLICEHYWLRSLLLTINLPGYLFSAIAIGRMADVYGRKFTLKITVIMEIVVQISLIFTKNLYLFMFLRLLHGFAGYGRYSCTLILCMETVGVDVRGRILVFFDLLWYFAYFVTLITCFFILDFRMIFLIGAIYQLLSLIVIKLLPESPRWELVSGDRFKARQVLRKYSTLNEETFNTNFVKLCAALDEDKKRELAEKVNIWSLFQNKKTAQIFVCLWVFWAFRSFLQDGLDYLTFDLPGSVFLNQSIFTSGACVANILMIFIVDKYERRTMLSVLFLTSSTMVLLCLFFIDSGASKSVSVVILLFLAHGSVSSGLGVLTCYTPEIFPTQIRSFCLGSCFAADKIAAATSSFINQVTASSNVKVSLIVLAIPGYIASSMLFFLPRTKGREMVDTIGQMINKHSQEHQLEQIT